MSGSSDLARRAAVLTLVTVAVIGVLALVVAAAGGGELGRALLGLRFAPMPARPRGAPGIAGTNLQLAAAALVAAWAVRACPWLREFLDLVLALPFCLNTFLLAAALAAYGPRLLEAIALHGPFEVVAFALAGGAYLSARAGELPARSLLPVTAVTAALVLCGAVVETCVRIGSLG